MGLCWGGVLNADWKNDELKIESSITNKEEQIERMSRFEESIFPDVTATKLSISRFLPHRDCELHDSDTILLKSSVVDGTDVRGFGTHKNKSFKWHLAIESSIKSIAMIPDRFFDLKGRHYSIQDRHPISVTTPTYDNPYFSVIYAIGRNKPELSPPAVIIIENNVEEKKRKIKIVFKGYYVPTNGVQTTEKQFVAYLEEIDNSYDNYDHCYTGCVIRPCGRKFSVLSEGENGHNFVSKDVNTGNELENFYDTYNNVENQIPVDDGVIVITEILSTDYFLNPEDADLLKITIDENNNYTAFLGKQLNINRESGGDLVNEENNLAINESNVYWEKAESIDTSMFKKIEMWKRFNGLNAMIYYLITKFESSIIEIKPLTNVSQKSHDFYESYDQITADHLEDAKLMNKLHAYINPNTMLPYDDDYWFHAGEKFYIKSFMLSTKKQKIRGKKIVIKSGRFPGLYMMVGETYIRDRATGKDEHLQMKFPVCKVLSNQTITLEADGDPTTFNLELEVASPENGNIMELISYETAPRLVNNGDGCFTMVDGSKQILSE